MVAKIAINGFGRIGRCFLRAAMADKEFREGVISVGESARITEFANKSRMEFETAKREFFNWYMQLETLVGVRMDTLLRKQ